MQSRLGFALALLALACFAAPSARAEPGPLVVPSGEVLARGALDVNLADGRRFEPVVIALDGVYGAAEGLEVGLFHSSERRTGFYVEQDGGFCVTGTDSGCIDFYGGPSLLARYQLLEGDLAVAAEGGAVILSLSDPFAASIKLGGHLRWSLGALWLELSPNVFVAVAGRTVESMGVEVDFNRERLHLPFTAGFSLIDSIDALVQVGLSGPIDGFADSSAGPVAAGARVGIDDRFSAFALFGFDNLIGNDGDLDDRRLSIGAAFRFTSM